MRQGEGAEGRQAWIDVVRKGNKNRSVDYKFCWRQSLAEHQQQKGCSMAAFLRHVFFLFVCVDLILIVVVAADDAADAGAATAITICHCRHSLDSAFHSNLFFAHFLTLHIVIWLCPIFRDGDSVEQEAKRNRVLLDERLRHCHSVCACIRVCCQSQLGLATLIYIHT